MVRAIEPGDWLQLEQFPAAVRFRSNDFLIAVQERSLAAFLVFRRLAADEIEILHLETLALFRRNGLARQLLQTFKKQESGSVFLEVRPSNTAALQLYTSEGFTEISRRLEYYSAPLEEAIVLKFHS